MKKFISIILLIASLTTIFSLSVLAEEQNATDLTIKSVIALSSTEVKVFFDGIIDINSVEDIANYDIHPFNSNTSIDILNAKYNSEGNAIILKTSTDFAAGILYKLQVNNICSNTVTKIFAGIAPKPEISIKSVTAISTNKVMIFFDGNINKYTVTNLSNYDIYNNDHIGITNIKYITYDNAVLITTVTDLEVGMLYKIDIKNICSEGNVTYYFAGTTSKPEVSVNSTIALSNTELKVFFEGDLDISKAENISNYYIIDNPSEILNAKYNKVDNSIILKITSGLDAGHLYKLVISNICNDGTITCAFAGTE
ncbi:hypothetical protein [Vallitalea guaymasensis]|uniref:SbsA Ig-like domain-containing protein n=1 Tax=Vallitalea guaymasensis TaxID=1185412 RepID=A0A8J8MA55_9FIRM|nr:hypothetical protein [Vallitalea guaymasensis]QUH29151.1 hypothetical protein HYG85_09530 [Vallitalea guaymasensis]